MIQIIRKEYVKHEEKVSYLFNTDSKNKAIEMLNMGNFDDVIESETVFISEYEYTPDMNIDEWDVLVPDKEY